MIKTLYPSYRYWSDGGSVYLISDTHFDDPDRSLMPYKFSQEELLKRINKNVHYDDTLIHLGDVGNPEWIDKMKGYKVLILGNHDKGYEQYYRYFDEVYSGALCISDKIILSHEPIQGINCMLNLHGHVHGCEDIMSDKYHFNICTLTERYGVVNLKDIIGAGFLKDIPNIHRLTIDEAVKRKAEKKDE